MQKKYQNAGCQQLAASGHSLREIGRRVNRSHERVRQWVLGRQPSAEDKHVLHSKLGIPIESWSMPADTSPAKPKRPPLSVEDFRATDSHATDPCADSVAALRAQAARLQEELDDPATSDSRRLDLEKILLRVQSALATITLREQPASAAQLVKTPAWGALSDIILGALQPYPDALAAVADALESSVEGGA